MAAEDTVARQADAFNAHDLDAFLAGYTEDVVVTSGNGDVLMEGLEAIRSEYAVMFEQLPDIRAVVHHRIVRGTWVVDDSRVTATGVDIEALVAYHVPGDHIDRVVVMTAEPEE